MSPLRFPKNVPFPTSHWTLVQTVQQGGEKEAALALDELCKAYWYPIYAFLRRSGHGDHDAEDLTQAFFQELISDETLLAARQDSGKLRTLLLAMLMRLLSNHTRDKNALKRGGGAAHVSLDELNAEGRYAHEPADLRDPESIFSHAWAEDLVAAVREKLRQKFAATGREQTFILLQPYLLWDKEPPAQRDIARHLGTSEAAARVLIFRLRHKFRELLRREVAKTVLSPEKVADELLWLQNTLAGK